MAGFFYFIADSARPGGGALTRQAISDAGLGYLLDGKGGPTVQPTDRGPEKQSGTFFTVAGAGGRGEPSILRAGEARWDKIPGLEAWIGRLEGESPGPEDLARAKLIDGYPVELADGKTWLVPVVRALGGGSRLPRAMVWDGRDFVEGGVRPAYEKLFAAGQRIWDLISTSPDGHAVTLSEATATSVAALAANYRIGPAEVDLLELLDSANTVDVVKALIDYPAVEGLRGKLGAATPS